ncbi:MAG: glutamine amidotransferase [Planctomycetota bacterium]|nr:glutamine amidotransferase [Planctomycetota bacterium]
MSLIYWLMGLDHPWSVAGATGWVFRAVAPLATPWLVLIALAGLVAAGLNLLPTTVATWRTRFLLVGVRLGAFALLLLLAAQVEVELNVTRRVQPTLAVLLDTSASMGLRDAGEATRLEAAKAALATGPLAKLGDQARVVRYDFDWDLHPHNDKAEPNGATRLIDSIASVSAREGDDLRAVVLLTDGNDTAGDHGRLLAPILAARRLPVHSIVVGRSDARGQARLRLGEGASVVRLGDEVRLRANLTATELPEQSVTVRVFQEGKPEPVASRENVRLGKENVDLTFVLKPERAGRYDYRVVAEGVKSAASAQALVAQRQVDVVDSRIHVLYVDIPRDERKILGHWLARDPVVDLATLTLMPKGGWYGQGAIQHKNVGEGIPNDEAELFKYDLVILGDIPRAYFRSGGDVAETRLQRLVDFVSRRVGGLVTLGGRSVYGAGQYQDSALARVLPFSLDFRDEPQIAKPFRISPTPSGLAHPLMTLEFEASTNREAWLDLPTLDGSNRVGAVRPGASLLAVRETDAGPVPLVALQNVGKGQVLSLAFDTSWRWEMMRPAEGEDYYRRFWGNAVRVLAPDPRLAPHRPQVMRYESNPAVGQTLTLATRLVDETFRPVANADISVRVTSPSGKAVTHLPKSGRQAPGLYEYDVRLDEPGSWEVATTYQGKTVTERIVAGAAQNELDDPRARPDLMAELAAATGGKSVSVEHAADLVPALDLSPRLETRPAAVALWNLPATLFLLLALVCVDCYVRKRRGMA